MQRNWLIGLAMAGCLLGAGTLPGVARAGATEAPQNASRSVEDIAEYVDSIDRRLQNGRYDVIDPGERNWIVDSIAGLRKEIGQSGADSAPSEDMVRLASEFEIGMLKIEEGGIVCRRERPTGSRITTQRCYSKKYLEHESERSQAAMRSLLRRPESRPAGD